MTPSPLSESIIRLLVDTSPPSETIVGLTVDTSALRSLYTDVGLMVDNTKGWVKRWPLSHLCSQSHDVIVSCSDLSSIIGSTVNTGPLRLL